MVVGAGPAAAHASVVSASPTPGSALPQAPGAVSMRFSEPFDPRLSRIDVVDARGRPVGVGATEPVLRDPLALRRRLGLLPPGVYTVRWVTMSRLDGHTLRGSYRFGVGTAASGAEHVRAGPVDSEGWLGLVGRWLALAGLTSWTGLSILWRPALRAGLSRRRLTIIGSAAPGLVILGQLAALASSALVSTGSVTGIGQVIGAGQSGQLRLVELMFAALGIVLALTRSALDLPWLFGAGAAGTAVVAEAWSGHAAAATAPSLAIASVVVHLAAVGVWVFAILAAVFAPRRTDALGVLWPYAVVGAVMVAATGLANAALLLRGPHDLMATGYGRAVLVKVAALITMGALGATHHLRRRAHRGEASLPRPVRLELVAAGLALATATALVGFPNPPKTAEAAERTVGVDPVLAGLGAYDAVSLAEPSGSLVVGVTVIPPRPGPVQLRVDLVGLDLRPGDRPANVRMVLTGPGGQHQQVALQGCGLGCFAAADRISGPGQWSFHVTGTSGAGPIDAITAAPLPSPDGRAAFAHALADLEAMRSVAMTEDLRGSLGSPPVVSHYRFSAPDAFEIQIGGRDQVVIGDHSYDQPTPGAPWVTSPWPGGGFSWPRGYYRSFWADPAAVRVIGHDQLDGQSMTVLSFLRPDLPAWFRLWVGDDDGLVHQERMRAEGHLMDHRFSQLNTAPAVVAPRQTP